ncbi:MAG: class I SAM-dependent methyltransferase [Candidatus Rifleibacteriota bacterium]
MAPDWKNEDGETFEQHAETLLQPLYPWFVRDLADAHGKPLNDQRVLEIGCGPGFLNGPLIDVGCSLVVELDISHQMLIKAKNRIKPDQTLLIQADSGALPFSSAKFSLVFSRGSIFFWEDLSLCFREISRVLKPGGMALIGGGYGISTPEELVAPVKEHARQSDRKKDIPRIDIESLVEKTSSFFSRVELIQARGRGFWLKCQK